jgi:hypothetical protein
VVSAGATGACVDPKGTGHGSSGCFAPPLAPSHPTHPGFIVMKKPTRGSRLTVLPSVKTKDFLRSRMADRMQ